MVHPTPTPPKVPVPPPTPPNTSRDDEEQRERESTASRIVRVVAEARAELWRTPEGQAHITFPATWAGGHRETHPLRSKAAGLYLRRVHHADTGRTPGAQAVADAVAQLEGDALFGGDEHAVAVRVAAHDLDGSPRLYLDLGGPTWEAVEVRPGGWSVVPAEASPVRFVRPGGLLALPRPAGGAPRGEAVRLLGGVLNADPSDLPLVLAWLLSALRPVGELPVLALAGEQGTGKSTAARALRSFIDPNRAALRTVPRTEHEAFIQATNGHVLCYDNVSGISAGVSDVMCRLSSGGGYSVREHYTNDGEHLYEAKRPQLLTGITDVVTRGDLAERTLTVTLRRIDPSERRTKAELDAALDAARPVVLGGLLDAAADGLRRLPSVRLAERPRLGDLAEWATACEPALGLPEGAFLRAHAASHQAAVEAAVEGDPVAEAVRAHVEGRAADGAGPFEGTMTDLLAALDAGAGYAHGLKRRPREWPRSARALSGRLRRAAPALRDLGLTVELDERTADSARQRVVRLGLAGSAAPPDRPHRPDRPESAPPATPAAPGPSAGPVRPRPSNGPSPREDGGDGVDGPDGLDGTAARSSPTPPTADPWDGEDPI